MPYFIRRNLCYTTLVPEGAEVPDGVETYTVECEGQRFTFVQASAHKGLLPTIMEHLLSYRKATKKQMKQYAKDDPMYAILDGRQNALKVSANSCYGFCGACITPNAAFATIASTASTRPITILDTKYGNANSSATSSFITNGSTDSTALSTASTISATDSPLFAMFCILSHNLFFAHAVFAFIRRAPAIIIAMLAATWIPFPYRCLSLGS